MQATLADSAVFVRYLRRRVTQLEGTEAAALAELKAAQQKRTREAPGELQWRAMVQLILQRLARKKVC